MPRQLKNIRIDEVSSVDRGAGKGVRVLLMKRGDDAESLAADIKHYESILAGLKRNDPESIVAALPLVEEAHGVAPGSIAKALKAFMPSKQNERNPTMDSRLEIAKALGPQHLAEAAFRAVAAGEISEHRFGAIQKQIAASMFPNEPNEGCQRSFSRRLSVNRR
jgi:hypothetical protein